MKPGLDYFESAGKRWTSSWTMTQNLFPDLPPSEKLDKALSSYLVLELEDDEGEHDRAVLLGAALAAVSRTKTHSQEALKKSAARILQPTTKRRFLGKVDTTAKRIALVAFPFFALPALPLWVKAIDYGRAPSSLAIVFTTAALLCLLLAFTRLTNWISRS